MKTSGKLFFTLLTFIVLLWGCAKEQSTLPVLGSGAYTQEDVLVSRDFKDRDTLVIVCRGFPMENTEELQKKLIMQKAAQLNALYFAKQVLNDDIDPGMYGTIEKTEYYNDYAEITYIIKKPRLSEYKRE